MNSFSEKDLAAPLRLQTDNFTDNQWGGDWIPRLKGLAPSSSPVGESWEFSAHPKRPSTVTVGDVTVPLTALLAASPSAMFGVGLAARLGGKPPFLLKFIDSRDDLSVQVHPGDAFARAHENDNGKAESWVILDSDASDGGGHLYVGFDPGRAEGFPDAAAFQEAFLSAIDQANGQGPSEDPAVRERAERLVLPFLNRVTVKAGEVYDLPPGTIHAIGRGVRLFEIQQDSDVTYRVWDWNRPDTKKLKEGKRVFRELHLERAKKVLDFRPRNGAGYRCVPRPAAFSGDGQRWTLLAEPNNLFAVDRLVLDGAARLPAGFGVLTVLRGRVRAGSLTFVAGQSALLPAIAGEVGLHAENGSAELLLSYVPG